MCRRLWRNLIVLTRPKAVDRTLKMPAVTDTHGAGFSLSSVTTQGLRTTTVLSVEPAIVLTGSDFAVSAKAYRVRV